MVCEETGSGLNHTIGVVVLGLAHGEDFATLAGIVVSTASIVPRSESCAEREPESTY